MDNGEKYCVYRHKSFDDRVYIGITCQEPNRRWRSGAGYARNPYFNRFLKKYGWDSMEHKILYSGLTLQEAEKKEIKLIQFYHSNNPDKGFNIQNGGMCYGTHTEESKQRMRDTWKSNNKNCKAVRCIETNITYKGVREAERQTGIASSNIISNCKGKSEYAGKTDSGSPLHWIYADEMFQIPSIIEKCRFQKEMMSQKENEMFADYKNKCIKKNVPLIRTYARKVVYQYNLQGELLATYLGVVEAAKSSGCNKGAIARRCNGYGLTCGGYLWSYELRQFSDDELLEAQNASNHQTILQYTPNMELVAEYPEGKGLIDNPKYRFQAIRNVCNKFEDFAYGYVWRYKGESLEQFENDKAYYQSKTPSHKGAKIIQLTQDGDIIKIFSSLAETETFGFNRNAIAKCCKGEKPIYKKYKWKYLTEVT